VDVSSVAYDALKTAVEHVLKKVGEGKKLSTEDIFILYLGTITGELKDLRTEVARLEEETNKRIDEIVKTLSTRIEENNRRIDEVVKSLSTRIDETNQRIDKIAGMLSQRIDETNKRIDELAKTLSARIDETNRRIDELAKRIDALQTTLLEIQKLLIELVKKQQ